MGYWAWKQNSHWRAGIGSSQGFASTQKVYMFCPVLILKTYLSQWPSEMGSPDHPFYLAATQNPEIWLKKQLLGNNYLGLFMKNMSGAGITARHTNHSVRLWHMRRLSPWISSAWQARETWSHWTVTPKLRSNSRKTSHWRWACKHVYEKEAPNSVRKILQPLSTVSSQSEPEYVFGSDIQELLFHFWQWKKSLLEVVTKNSAELLETLLIIWHFMQSTLLKCSTFCRQKLVFVSTASMKL